MHQFVGLGPPGPGLEPRQDGCPRGNQEGAAAGDLHRRIAGFGQVAEQLPHGRRRFEPVFARDASTVFLSGEGTVRDAHQGVVRLRLGGLGVVHVIGGNQGDVMGVGPFDQPPLRLPLAGEAVALQLDIEPVAEYPRHLVERGIGLGRLALHEQGVNRPVWPAGQQDQAFGSLRHHRPRDARFIHRSRIKEGRRRQGAKVQPAGVILDRQHHGRDPGPAFVDLATDAGHRQGAGHDRLNARSFRRLGKLQRPEQIGPVRHTHRRHARIRRQGRNLPRLDRAFQQRIGRADPQVDELRGCSGG